MESGRPDWLARNRLRFTLLVVTLMCVAVFFPGRPPPKNHLRWGDPAPGLRFEGISQALSEKPIVSETGGLTLEVWLAPDFVSGRGNQEIVSFYDSEFPRPLLLGQFPRGFFLRGRADNARGDPRADVYLDFESAGIDPAKGTRHLALTVGGSGTRLHINGIPTQLSLPMTRAEPGKPFGGHLLLGSSNTGWPSWTGGVLGVAVHERELSSDELWEHAQGPLPSADAKLNEDASLLALYRLDEGQGTQAASAVAPGLGLVFPTRITRPTRTNLLSTDHLNLAEIRRRPADVVLNVLGFMPLGFLICWRRGPTSLWLAVATGIAFSLSIELLQALIPGRSSSLGDVVSNGVGALTGGLCARFWGTR